MVKPFSLFFLAGFLSAAVDFQSEHGGATFVSNGAAGAWRIDRDSISVSANGRAVATLRFDGSRGSGVMGETATEQGFGRVRIREVYPGIDVVVYGKGRDIEYDLEVAAGADPSSIRLSWSGAAITEERFGAILASNGGLAVRQSQPVAYQSAAGAGQYSVAALQQTSGDTTKFQLGPYDPTRPLVIDPVLSLVDLRDAVTLDAATASASDAQGNLYIAGQTRASANGSSDFFVTKLSRDRKMVYTKRIGGSSAESGAAIAVDSLGNAFVSGVSTSADFPVMRALQSTPRGETNGVLFKLDPAGDVVYSTFLGGSEALTAKAVGVDGAGSPAVLFDSGSFARIMKLRADGGAVEYDWTGPVTAGAMSMDLQGNITLAGRAGSDFAATPGALSDESGTIAILRLSAGGRVLAAARATSGSFSERVADMAVDAAGSVFLTGEAGAAGGVDGFALRFDNRLSQVLYRAKLGASGADHPHAIAVDAFGIATIVGVTESTDLEAVNALDGTAPAESGSAGFIARVSGEGVVLVQSYLPSGEVALSASSDHAGAVWLAGRGTKGASVARFEPGADGAIELRHSGAIQAGRSGARFTVRSMNTGSETLGDRAVTIAEAPAGIEVAEMFGAGWACAEGICRRTDPLAPGHEDPVVVVMAKVAANVSGVQHLSAKLAVADDGIAQNSASADRFNIAFGPDLVVQKVHFGDFSQGQNGATYLIRVTNTGTQPTSGTVSLTDTLPQGITLVSMTGTGWTCSTATCTRQDALAPDQTFPQITVTVNVAVDAPASVANSATVSGGGDADTTNNTAIDATVIRGPDLRITKTHSQNFLPGQQGAQYVIAVANGGSSPSRGTVTVTDTLPAGLSLVAMSGNGWNCVQTVCTRADALAAGGSYPQINVSVNVAADAPTLVTNTASVSGGGDTDGSNNTVSDPTSVQPGIDLRISKTHVSGTRRNALITYDIVVTNIGTMPSSGTVTMSDTLPSALALDSVTGNGWACLATSCSRSDSLAPGASYPAIRLVALSSATAPPSVTNIAAVFADNDISSANNVAAVTTNLAYSDLTINKSHAGAFVRGLKGRYSIVVSNNGTAATTEPAVVTDTLPAGLTLSSAGGPGWNCVANVCTSTDRIAPNSSLAPLTIITDVAANAPDNVTNTASVTGTDDTPGNNSASDPTPVTDPTDLRITKVHNGGDFVRGQQGATYTITVSNIGSSAGSGIVQVNEILPAGLTLVNMQGAGWSCAGAACTRSDFLNFNQSYQPITVTVDVATDSPLQLINTAVLSGGGDNNAANNTAIDVVAVGAADLQVAKTHAGNFFRGQQGATYEITVTNGGVAPALGTVTVTDTLPPGMTLFSAIGAGWSCTQSTCSRSDALAPNTSYPILRIRVNVASDAPALLTNVATVFGGNDANTTNNSAADPTTINASGSGGPAAPDILVPTAGQVVTTSGVTFQWTPVSGVTGYDIRIVESQSSSVIFSGVLSGSGSVQTLVSLPNGVYAFRVRSCSGGFSDATCGTFASQNFTVAATGPTTSPTPSTPTANQTITGSTVNFSWTPVTGAVAYELRITEAASGQSELQMRVSAPGTSAIYSIRSGVFDMVVRACTQLCGPWSAARRFTIALGSVPTAQPEISLATFGDNSITVSWLPIPSADLFRILVVQPGAGPGGGALTVASRRVSGGPANFQIPAGNARVLVAACNGDGCGPFATSDPISPSAAQPTVPILAAPEPGSSQTGPVVLFTWNRIPGDNGTNTWYRLFVQDQSRQGTALDVMTRNNFFAANFKAEGTRYDSLVIANPDGPVSIQGPPLGFVVRGNSPAAPTAVAPRHQGTVQAGNVELGWTPVPGATLYEYYVSGPANPVARGVTPGLLVQAPLAAVNNQPTPYQMIVRACPAGATCSAGSDAGWGPWSQSVTGVITFTVAP